QIIRRSARGSSSYRASGFSDSKIKSFLKTLKPCSKRFDRRFLTGRVRITTPAAPRWHENVDRRGRLSTEEGIFFSRYAALAQRLLRVKSIWGLLSLTHTPSVALASLALKSDKNPSTSFSARRSEKPKNSHRSAINSSRSPVRRATSFA